MQNRHYRHPCINLEVNNIHHEVRAYKVRIESITETKGVMTIDFCEDGHNTNLVLQNIDAIQKQYLMLLRNLIKEMNTPGQISAHWRVLDNNSVKSMRTIRDIKFQIKVVFRPEFESGETFVEAALRIYGQYLDLFKIPREDASGLSFDFKQYVFERRSGETKRSKMLVQDYLKMIHGF